MSEFTVRSDSGEMSGSRELGSWATAFVRRFCCLPLEWYSDEGHWTPTGNGWVTKTKYRLTDQARAILREEEAEDEPEQQDAAELHRVGVFDNIHNLLDQAKQQVNAELEFFKRLNNCHLEELSVVRAALDESRADEKRLVSERDTARDAAARYYAKAEERQGELKHSLKSESELLSELNKLTINMNSKWWLLRRLVLLMIGVKR
jgi:hypothetical protein